MQWQKLMDRIIIVQPESNYKTVIDQDVIIVVINPIKYKSHINLKCDLQTLYKWLINTLLLIRCTFQQQAKMLLLIAM